MLIGPPSCLTLFFTHFLSYSIFDPSSTLDPTTIAFPMKIDYCEAPYPKPKFLDPNTLSKLREEKGHENDHGSRIALVSGSVSREIWLIADAKCGGGNCCTGFQGVFKCIISMPGMIPRTSKIYAERPYSDVSKF